MRPNKNSHYCPTRSIYGPRKQALTSNAKKPSSESGTPKYRGAAHPLCFADEVLEYEFLEGFKPVNIEAYARHWLKSLPENTIGSWEELEDAFRANFQGTYVRPPDADDLSN